LAEQAAIAASGAVKSIASIALYIDVFPACQIDVA